MNLALGRFAVPADDPTLPGHFPGAPVVPGALLLQRVLDAVADAGLSPGGFRQVKFLAPLGPDEPVILAVAPPAGGGCRFTLRRGELPVATGVVTLRGGRP